MNPEVVSGILSMLRDARALVYRDSESFDEAAAVLEHVGQLLAKEIRVGLGKYKGELLDLAEKVSRYDSRYLQQLFMTVKDARNDSVHSGAFIRHHVLRLVELILILEEAISMNASVAEDLMVRNPLTVEKWHNVATVRRNMLSNSFSFLPIFHDDKWQLISDRCIVSFLRDTSNAEYDRRLGATLKEIVDKLELDYLVPVSADTPVRELKSTITHLPILVVNSENNLLGILTAFDLL